MSGRRKNNANARTFDPVVAAVIGLDEAVILSQLKYWVEHNAKDGKHYHDGKYWTYNTFEQWQKDNPWFSLRTIKRIFARLEQRGLILTGRYNEKNYDQTRWYTVNYEKIAEITGYSIVPKMLLESFVRKKRELKRAENELYGYPPIYYDYIASNAWKEKRKQRLAIDNLRCSVCGTAKNLQVHHITYERLGHEEMDDLITVCKKCHEKIHEHDIEMKLKNDRERKNNT